MISKMIGLFGIGTLLATLAPESASQSATSAKELTAMLVERNITAIAAKDPDEPDRFVAALFIPNNQLLVISARYAVPSVLESKVSNKQYRDVYLDLQGAALPGSSFFIQDMRADGLCSSRDQAADVVYDGPKTPRIFDGDWNKHGVSEQAYEQQYLKADQEYGRLLNLLVDEAAGHAVTP
jgi:hypothetical protein